MNITYFRVFLGILGHYSIQYLNFAKKWFNSLFNSKISRKFNSKKYSIKKIQLKKYSIQKFATKIQFKIWFKMLNLAGFNSTIYSFNNKTLVSLTPIRCYAKEGNIKQVFVCKLQHTDLNCLKCSASAQLC